tara:strand:+ start:140 stop:484 length:345 start_codon:yes stop_codon:yes gene_type:complete
MKARSAKAKGTRLEQFLTKVFGGMNWNTRRQPGSGIFRDFPHDVYAETDQGQRLIVECKSWKHGWRTGDKAMGAADMLVIKRDFGEPNIYMPLKIFEEIIKSYQDKIESLARMQ